MPKVKCVVCKKIIITRKKIMKNYKNGYTSRMDSKEGVLYSLEGTKNVWFCNDCYRIILDKLRENKVL